MRTEHKESDRERGARGERIKTRRANHEGKRRNVGAVLRGRFTFDFNEPRAGNFHSENSPRSRFQKRAAVAGAACARSCGPTRPDSRAARKRCSSYLRMEILCSSSPRFTEGTNDSALSTQLDKNSDKLDWEWKRRFGN